MTSRPSVVYFVSGANRGIGLGLVEHILEKHPDAFVYAGARDPAKTSSLEELSLQHSGRLSIVKCVSADEVSNARAAAEIKERHGRIDTVIANAGMMLTCVTFDSPIHAHESHYCTVWEGVAEMTHTAQTTPLDLYREHFEVNFLGPVVLFQTMHELLKASASPRFIPISSLGGSIGGPSMSVPSRTAAYGASKAALNSVTRKIHFENDWLIAFPLSPGAVLTDAMRASDAKDSSGSLKKMRERMLTTLTPQQAAVCLLTLIDESTREKEGGQFINIDRTIIPW